MKKKSEKELITENEKLVKAIGRARNALRPSAYQHTRFMYDYNEDNLYPNLSKSLTYGELKEAFKVFAELTDILLEKL